MSVSASVASGQSKEIIQRQQTWVGYFTQIRFTDKLGFWGDTHLRRTDQFIGNWSQSVVRGGLMYFLSDQTRLIAGYAYLEHFPEKGKSVTVTEHRPWQMIQWTQKYPGFQTNQNIRFEQRFRERTVQDAPVPGYSFNFRLRYSFQIRIPLKGKQIKDKTPYAVISDEVMVNFGKEIIYNYFDQNRFVAGVGYQFTNQLHAQLNYMNLFQQAASGNRYFNTHAIRLFIYHTVDLRNAKK
jgi:hypothetical protein